MKKLFALLLALALLVPMGLVSVASADEAVTAEPFYSLGWSDFDESKYPYLDGLVTTSFSNIGDKARLSITDGGTLMYGSYTDADVEKFAQAMKKIMDARPEGTRYWHLFGPGKILRLAPQNVIFMDHGVTQMKDLVTAVLKKYKEIGGQLDGMVIDTEYIGVSSYYIRSDTDNNTNNAIKNPLVYKQIVDDPRYATQIRPYLEERGFKFYDKITDYTPEIYGISGNAGSEYSNCAAIWDTVIRNHMNRYIDEYAYAPLKEYFPDASLSDYQSTDSYAWMKFVAVTDDGIALTGGNSNKAGSASCFSFYWSRPSSDTFKNMTKYASFNDALFEASAYNMFMYEMNYAKHMYLSNPQRQIAPWITSYLYNDDREGGLANTPYYSEQIFHLGMLDPEPFLSYTYVNEYQEKGATKISYTAPNYLLTQQIQNELLAELTRVAGYSDRKPIEMEPYWNSEFVLSGMYANGRNIWRITPNTDEVSLEDFKVEGTDPTFRVDGQTVTFPGGKIIETTAIPTAGSCGYWVETAKDVMPIVTNDPDRFDKYPALLYDFEDVKEGSFNYNTSVPTAAWEFTWKKGGTSTIKTVDGNKVLALLGNAEVRSVKLPANVTAGDTYAEDQAWELTVTIPEGLAAEAEIVLLSYTGAGTTADDGGFKIVGGKAYYSENGEYKELMDIAAGTYTFKRVMDFNDGKAACTYYVYDADRKELKATQKVATPAFTSITNIKFSTTGADKDVLVDNYKLSVTGTGADLSLYNANTGMNVDATKANAVPTAYRLSWLNATDQEQTATVKAEIYEGETLKETKTIQELKMAPGCDGVETGVVEIAEGQSVKITVTSTAKVTILQEAEEAPSTTPSTDPTDPATDPTDPSTAPTEAAPTEGADTGKKGGSNIGLIAVIAAVVVAVVAVVVVLLVTGKKPAKKADDTEEPKAEE